MIGRDQVEQLVRLFHDQLRSSLPALTPSASRAKIEEAAHALVSSAGNLGLVELSARCQHLLASLATGVGEIAAPLAEVRAAAARADALLAGRYPGSSGHVERAPARARWHLGEKLC